MIGSERARAQEEPAETPRDEPGSDPLPADSLAINVEGREITAPDDGFGQLWRKRYRIHLTGADVAPEAVVRTWRERFGEFWPEGNRFYRSLTGIQPGEVALADLEMLAGSRLSTGIVVTRVEPTSFTFMTPQGHTFAGEITFSAYQEAGTTLAQVEILMRPSDPIFEIGMPLGGHKREDAFWETTLTKLAGSFGVTERVEMITICIDRRRKWRNATNIVHNAYIHTGIYMATRPFRMLVGRLRAGSGQS